MPNWTTLSLLALACVVSVGLGLNVPGLLFLVALPMIALGALATVFGDDDGRRRAFRGAGAFVVAGIGISAAGGMLRALMNDPSSRPWLLGLIAVLFLVGLAVVGVHVAARLAATRLTERGAERFKVRERRELANPKPLPNAVTTHPSSGKRGDELGLLEPGDGDA